LVTSEKTETGGFIDDRRIKILASKSLARLAQCSFQQAKISQAWRSAAGDYQLALKLKHLTKMKKADHARRR